MRAFNIFFTNPLRAAGRVSRITPLSRYRQRGAEEGKRSSLVASGTATRRAKENEPRSRDDVVKKVVDELRNDVHNLVSLLLKTQRC